jgi:hypothetical protein
VRWYRVSDCAVFMPSRQEQKETVYLVFAGWVEGFRWDSLESWMKWITWQILVCAWLPWIISSRNVFQLVVFYNVTEIVYDRDNDK